jgi:hypothetical protein
MGQMRNAYRIWSENLKGRDYFAFLGVNGTIILKKIGDVNRIYLAQNTV